MKDSETLWAARDMVERGWVKGYPQTSSGEVCAGRAVMKVSGQDIWTQPAIVHLCDTLRSMGLATTVVGYNDRKDTTKRDILDLFEKTAIRLEEQGL